MPVYTPPEPMPFSALADYPSVQAAAANAAADIVGVRPNTPSDGSPGKLILVYHDLSGTNQTCGMRLTTVANPYDYNQMLTEANRIAPAFAQALPGLHVVDGFKVENDQGVIITVGLLSTVHVGTHLDNDLTSWSYSVAITGRGLAPGPGFFPGNELIRFFPQTGYPHEKGRKFISLAADLGLVRWAGALGTSTICWADAHGWKAGIRPTCPIQYNAAVQRKKGI